MRVGQVLLQYCEILTVSKEYFLILKRSSIIYTT